MLIGIGVIWLILACAIIVFFIEIVRYSDPFHDKVAAAGYIEKDAQINSVHLRYVEGPDNGPPLVLLHAQHLDWFSYSRVLPSLAKSFHVFDIDYPGHGKTTTPDNYPMTAEQVGADLADFIRRYIGKPVYITGNSSGGLLAVWLAANRPELISAAVLEDPPLFSAEYPRIQKTIANRSFASSYQATRDDAKDFLLYWVRATAPFFTKHVGPGSAFLLTQVIRLYRLVHLGKPIEIGLLRNDTVRFLVRGLDEYDPRFGAAFYDGSWNKGFDHADALRKVHCPTLLIHANTAFFSDGTLNGAMSDEDAARAMALLKQGTYVKVDANHVVNLDKPAWFVAAVEGFFKK